MKTVIQILIQVQFLNKINLLIAAMIIALPTLSFAFPKVGDYSLVQMLAKTEEGEVLETFHFESRILEYSQAKDKFLLLEKFTRVSGNVTEEIKTWYSSSDLVDQQTINRILSSCPTAESFKIIIKETPIDTCRISSGDGLTWLGAVPFGLVKFKKMTEEGVFEGEVIDFEFGK